mgnify:CR=1 FL=1
MKFQSLFLFIFLIVCNSLHSQILEGNIFDQETKTPLQAATVYLDGTTISTITDENGYFKINGAGSKSTLVISFVGYKTSRIDNPFQYKKIKTYLELESFSMEEVFIGKSVFTRKSMLKAFRESFLGTSEAGRSCKIENEDALNFFYDEVKNTFTATSRVSLKIKNSRLGYEIYFDLVDFNVEFSRTSLSRDFMKKSSFAGTAFYKDISKSKKDKERLESYLGSASHLMETIASESWEKEKFRLYVGKFQVDPKEYFAVKDTLNIRKVTIIKQPTQNVAIYKPLTGKIDYSKPIKPEIIGYEDKKTHFNILYDKKKQSVADFYENEFIVDENGNYSPIYVVMFSGYIGFLKVGDMLPSDYYQTIKGKY